MPEEMAGHDGAARRNKDCLVGNKRAGALRQGLMGRQKQLDAVALCNGPAIGKGLFHSLGIAGCIFKQAPQMKTNIPVSGLLLQLVEKLQHCLVGLGFGEFQIGGKTVRQVYSLGGRAFVVGIEQLNGFR